MIFDDICHFHRCEELKANKAADMSQLQYWPVMTLKNILLVEKKSVLYIAPEGNYT